MADKSWKRHEREIAHALGGVRLPNTGKGGPDGLTDRFAIETKVRKSLPLWLWRAVHQAQANAPVGKTPVVVLVESRQGVKARRLVVLAWEAFLWLTDMSPARAHIDAVLQHGPLSMADLVEETGLCKSTVRLTLHRGKKKGHYLLLGGNPPVWGLMPPALGG